jgi:hypothetical protein
MPQAFLTSALDGGEWPVSRFGHYIPGNLEANFEYDFKKIVVLSTVTDIA